MTYVKIEQHKPWYRSGHLGRNINHDPRSKGYRVPLHPLLGTTKRWNRLVPVLDQGDLGSCTGNAGIGAIGTDPNYNADLIKRSALSLDEKGAIALYSAATKLDDEPQNYPPTDTGSDGLSIAKALQTGGLISGYQHAFGINDAFSAIQQGPLIVGTYWTNGMYSPDKNAVVKNTGKILGGHEYECIGYDAATDLWEFVNSWGTSFGKAGHFFYSSATFSSLLDQQGDIVLFTPASQPAPLPTPVTPSPVPVVDAFTTAASVLDPWAVRNPRLTAAKAWNSYAAAVRTSA